MKNKIKCIIYGYNIYANIFIYITDETIKILIYYLSNNINSNLNPKVYGDIYKLIHRMNHQNSKTDRRHMHDDKNITSTVMLELRVSCDTFWKYSFHVPIHVNDYYDNNSRNMNRMRDNQINNPNSHSATCEIGRIGQNDPMFVRLESYLVDYVIDGIYEDVSTQTNNHELLQILLKKARKFHIHGRTVEDILFPNSNPNSHSTEGYIVYICTHC